MREHINNTETSNLLQSSQEINLTREDLSTVIDAELEPGQFSIHHSMAAHGSDPNRSDRPRIGLSINFISAKVKQTLGPDSAMRAQGKVHPEFVDEPRQDDSFSASAIKSYKSILTNLSSFSINSPDWDTLLRRIH
ncbi:MAG: phytanoyl-CoA dioxygenase family protein [bacterium]